MTCPATERLDAYLDTLDEADSREARAEERRHLEAMVEIGNIAFVVSNYDLQTGELIP